MLVAILPHDCQKFYHIKCIIWSMKERRQPPKEFIIKETKINLVDLSGKKTIVVLENGTRYIIDDGITVVFKGKKTKIKNIIM